MKEKILEILTDLRPDVDFENEKALITDNVIESFDIIELISRLGNEFDVEISPKELTAVNFDSLDAITALIARLVEEEED
ncbi:MAG: acyl carrier protein [Lachnospiraceae bacterium]|nr:acyl carrier protein [Lachnospiraceae bacterium]